MELGTWRAKLAVLGIVIGLLNGLLVASGDRTAAATGGSLAVALGLIIILAFIGSILDNRSLAKIGKLEKTTYAKNLAIFGFLAALLVFGIPSFGIEKPVVGLGITLFLTLGFALAGFGIDWLVKRK